MYVDSIYAKTFKEVAKLVSPMTTVPMSGCLTFQYQHGEEQGHLFSVYTRDQVGQYQELWRAEPERQSEWAATPGEWIPVQVDLKAPYSLQVRGGNQGTEECVAGFDVESTLNPIWREEKPQGGKKGCLI